MKKTLIKFAGVTLAAGALVAVPKTADAAGCAFLVSTYQSGATNYAKVRNVCKTTISARPTLNNWPDPSCRNIAAYKTVTFRTGGSLSPKASGAVVC